ncbi:pyridoxamine 5'-phosphate oxidase family protein [Pelagibius sp. CAU 1746]|uniref:pyridoxamine 5'-phosphate oxidase family protein n=1 Tax=Pelagibius sp. CAU 1746 TaxID=3140370 RepID=UPI00325BF3A5
MTTITTAEHLEEIYGRPSEASLVKETGRITPQYRAFIEASPFVALATSGPGGLDCSPRGELGGVLHIEDEQTLMLPDRRGNNRIDSLKNLLHDPRVALLFLVPGSGSTIRVNGRAKISVDPALLERFAVKGKAPRSVLVITVETVFFQCARAIVRSELWNPENHVDPKSLPTPGQILAAQSEDRVGGAAYDEEWPERARKTLW